MPQTDPLLLRVQKALTAALNQITPENGFTVDLSTSVFRGRARFGSDDPMPMVCILEPPMPPEVAPSPGSSTVTHGQWDLLIQGFVEDDSENPTDPAHHLAANVRAVLAALNKGRGKILAEDGDPFGLIVNGSSSCVTKVTVGRPVVRPPDDEISSKAFFWMSLSLMIAEDIENPFA